MQPAGSLPLSIGSVAILVSTLDVLHGALGGVPHDGSAAAVTLFM